MPVIFGFYTFQLHFHLRYDVYTIKPIIINNTLLHASITSCKLLYYDVKKRFNVRAMVDFVVLVRIGKHGKSYKYVDILKIKRNSLNCGDDWSRYRLVVTERQKRQSAPGEKWTLTLEALGERKETVRRVSWSVNTYITNCDQSNQSVFKYTHRSTITAGIWTNWTGLLPSFKACVKLSIWPRITDICRSKKLLSNPLSCCKLNVF